mmetsp:Transcript_5252/g.9465  ORF Transcript_5252/g.9465 Transcript_5252/m.9465 type:complete len:89 (-) Transcript_5252:1180-1446(-)
MALLFVIKNNNYYRKTQGLLLHPEKNPTYAARKVVLLHSCFFLVAGDGGVAPDTSSCKICLVYLRRFAMSGKLLAFERLTLCSLFSLS